MVIVAASVLACTNASVHFCMHLLAQPVSLERTIAGSPSFLLLRVEIGSSNLIFNFFHKQCALLIIAASRTRAINLKLARRALITQNVIHKNSLNSAVSSRKQFRRTLGNVLMSSAE